MIDDIVAAVSRTVEDAERKMLGVQLGSVISMLDPLMLGRVQVELPSIDALDLAPWARVAVPMAEMQAGFYFVPQVGDQVLVAFEHGNLNAPYIIGSVWTAMSPPPLQSPEAQVRCIRTLGGNQLVFEELSPAITLQTGPTTATPMPASPTGPNSTVRLSPERVEVMHPREITLQVGANTVTISPEKATVTVGASSISMTASSIEISGPSVSVKADGLLELRGGMVTIN